MITLNSRAPLGSADVPSIALALALPVLLLSPDYVPVISSWRGVELRPSDVVIAAFVALVVFYDRGRRLRLAVRPWLWFAPFLVLLLVSAATVPDAGRVTTAVLKLIEYFVFGVAATAVLRDSRATRLAMICIVGCAGALGILGGAEVLLEHRAGGRAESLIGTDPLGLLGAVTLTIALAAPNLLGGRNVRRFAYASGLLCLTVAASLSATLGLALAGAFAAALRLGPFARLRAASLAAVAVLALGLAGALVAVRWSDFRAAAGQVTGSPAQPQPGGSFVHRMMFADFGVRIWLDHPLLGIGFQQTNHLSEWAPYFASVRADFPALSISYFPSFPGMSFGQTTNQAEMNLHNAYSQLLAETGLVGLALFGLGFMGTAGPAFRHARNSELASVGALLVLLELGAFTRNELYGGLPETTLLVIALAFAVCGGTLSRTAGHARHSGFGPAPPSAVASVRSGSA